MTTLTPANVVVGAPCPNCAWSLTTERHAEPWCPRCGWNIDCYEPDRRRQQMRWKWTDKLSFQTAYDLNERQFADLSGRPVDKPEISVVSALLMLIAVILLAGVLGFGVFGVWLIVHFHNWVLDIVGVIVIFIAIALRPRFGRLGKYVERVDPADLPTLNRLLTDVVTVTKAKMPHYLVFSEDFNASSAAYGLRRRRVLTIGLPLWLSLTPQERVSLLGHEVGHFVNGDIRRGPLTRFAFEVMHHLVYITTPDRGRSQYATGRFGGMRSNGLAVIGDLISRWILWVFSAFFSICELLVGWLGARASHHAEYAADGMAVRVGGSVATASLFDVLLQSEACGTVLRRALRNDPSPEVWRREVLIGRQGLDARRAGLRQLSMRDEASLFRSHPPSGLRSRLVESRQHVDPAVVLTEGDAAAIERELAARYRSMRASIANSH